MVVDLGDVTVARTHVMSCEARVLVAGAGGGASPDWWARYAIARLHELERRWSRFLPNSEISALNASGGRPRIVSGDTIRLIEAAVRCWYATGGAFDPTLLGALVELGYDTSRDDADRHTSLAAGVSRRGHPEGIVLDRTTGWVCLPAETAIDPGGIGKGLAADIVVEELLASAATGALVEVGGDLRVGGVPPSDGVWTISVSSSRDRDPRTVQLAGGAVATSSNRLRTWTRAGRPHHHLIDPRSLRSTSGDVVSCTVIAGTGAWAEAFTKVAFVDGVRSAMTRFEELGLAASIVSGDGTSDTSAWREFCR